MSKQINDGGPAFPNSTPNMPVNGSPGMSLRDWFASQAMAALTGRIVGDLLCNAAEADTSPEAFKEALEGVPPQIIGISYAMASGMIAARNLSETNL